MMDTMYTVPSETDIVKCIITKEVILGTEKPKLVMGEEGMIRRPSIKRATKKSKGEIA